MSFRIAGLSAVHALSFAASAFFVPSPAVAQVSHCGDLWHQRNQIFADAGYCFKSAKGKAAFPRACFPPYGKISASAKLVVEALKALEAESGCVPGTRRVEGTNRYLPIIVGGDDLDACGSSGRISGLEQTGSQSIAVRTAPTGHSVAEVPDGEVVFMCDEISDYVGIVFPDLRQSLEDCDVSSPSNSLRFYDGPCLYGWVPRKFITLVAG